MSRLKLTFFISILFVVLSINKISSQETLLEETSIKKETTWNLLKEDGKSIFGGVKHAYSAPFKWKKDDWLTFGGIALGTTLLYIYDEETNHYFVNQNEGAPQMLKEIGWYYGSPQNFFMISTGIYGYGLLAKNDKFRDTGVLILSSAVATGFIQTVLKNGVGRARPSTGFGKDSFDPFSKESFYHSFPSGHAMLSFTASHAIAKQFDNIWIKGGIYGVGLIAPISRLWIDAHWLSDVVLGMVISIVVVDSIDNFLNGKNTKKRESKIAWKLRASAQTIGLVGTF